MSAAEFVLWLVVVGALCVLAARAVCWFVGLFGWWCGWDKDDPHL